MQLHQTREATLNGRPAVTSVKLPLAVFYGGNA